MNIRNKFLKILESNQRETDGFRYTLPSSDTYPHQWFWDSCFHSIIYTRLGNTNYARDEIRSLLKGQWENGMIPHMIYWQKSEEYNINWGTDKNTSSITQPPMIAYAVERIYEKTRDMNFVKEVFRRLDRYYKWLHNDRSDNYLLSVIHPWETGGDDLITWDSIYGVENPSKEILMKNKLRILNSYINTKFDSREFIKRDTFNVKSVLFNTIYLVNLESMSRLAEIINSDETRYYKEIIVKVRKSYNELFDKETGLYMTRHNKGFTKNIETPLIFLPLFANILSKSQAKKLVNVHLKQREILVKLSCTNRINE